MTVAFDPESQEPRTALTRRDFAKAIGSVAIAASTPIGLGWATAPCEGSNRSSSTPTAVGRFHASLSVEQRKAICFPFDHPLRGQVSNNWAIVRPSIRDLSFEQRVLCREVFKNLCSDEGYDRFLRQMEQDYGGFDRYHVALFGEPGTENPFEWVLTGRHNTLRADGNRETGAGCGGPIFYGHGSPISVGGAGNGDNVWWYQAEAAGKVFQSLDGRERTRALVTRATRGRRHDGEPIPEMGLEVGSLDGPRKALVRDLLKSMLGPFRDFAVPAVQRCLLEEAATDALRLTFFENGDRGANGPSEIWKLEGPSFAWYYHGSPHVHAWLNIKENPREA